MTGLPGDRGCDPHGFRGISPAAASKGAVDTRTRVAVVTAFPVHPERPRGGVEAVAVTLVRSLSEFANPDVHVVTIDSSVATVNVTQWHSLTMHRLPRLAREPLYHALGPGGRQIREYLRRLAPDVVHSNDIYGLMVRGLPIPRVFTVHGFIHVDTAMQGGRLSRLRARAWKHFELRSWAEQPHIISISPFVREKLRGIGLGQIHGIDNPVPEALFEATRRPLRGVIFSTAHVSRLKNTLGLLESFRRMVAAGCDARLRLAGSAADQDYGRAVREFIARAKLADRVDLLGQVSADRARAELAGARAFALLSLQENAPMGVAEAMAAAVPVVPSNRCGMPFMVRDGESGFLVDPTDPDDAARRLRMLVEDDALCRRMGEVARQIAKERFHPTVAARKTRDVYQQAVRSGSPLRI